jgi:hypothetical protein
MAMAHPLYHARSSAHRFGGVMDDYLAFHSWIDFTKSHIADCRHRLLLHNSWGIFVIEWKFGAVFTRASDGKQVPTRTLAERHIIEDLREIPTLARCLDQLAPEDDIGAPDCYAQCRHSASVFGGDWADYLPVHRFLDWPREHVPDGRHRRVLHNGWGIALAGDILGETLTRADGAIASVRQVAEEHIRHELGHIPTIDASLDGLALAPWMCMRAAPLSRVPHVSDLAAGG